MKRYLIDEHGGSNLYKFDKETESIECLYSTYTNIDYLWIADTDGVAKINGEDKIINAGDVVLCMYGAEDRSKREYIIINDPALRSYYSRVSDSDAAKRMKGKISHNIDCCANSECAG